MNNMQIKTYKTSGIRDPFRLTSHLILVPDRLPVKVSIRGINVMVNTGEAAFIPMGTVLSIGSSAERFMVCFDPGLLNDNPEFTVLLPVFSVPYIIKSTVPEESVTSKAFGCILPIRKEDPYEPSEEKNSVTPLTLLKALINAQSLDGAGADKAAAFFTGTASHTLLTAALTLIGQEILSSFVKDGKSINDIRETLGRLSLAVRCVNTRYPEDLNGPEIAKEAGYNHAHLSHIFKAYYGIPLNDYLTKTRVAAAARLLTEGNGEKLTMPEIGGRCGFNSSTTFNRTFRNETGCSPRDYVRLPEGI